MQIFKRRIYRSVPAFLADLRVVLAQREQMKPLMQGELLEAAFRERLMLAVTAVNRCRYCSYVHARQALVAGLAHQEVEALQLGDLANSPPEEASALLYAHHWAETQGKPANAARRRIIEQYGEAQVEAIELALRTIQMGNLLGNTLDYILYRLSLGRWGAEQAVAGR